MTAEAYRVDLPTRRATIHFARRCAPLLRGGDLVILDGSLGSGKTFWVRALCRALGLPEREPVTSPTFTLVQEIETRIPVAHADVYRLSTDEDVERIGLRSMRDEGRLLIVEWGKPYVDLLGGDALVIEFEVEPRRATVFGTGARSREVAHALSSVPPHPETL